MGGAHGSAREVRGGYEIGSRKPKGKCISMRAPVARGPDVPMREVAACEEERVSAGELGWLGQIIGED
jgi:hypothetical protein